MINWNVPAELQNRQNPMVTRGRRPNPVDMTEAWVVDDALCLGIYHGTQPGLKLASAVAFPIVSVPVAFMGLPTFSSDNPTTQELLTQAVGEMASTLQKTYTLRPVVGTAWLWPNWDAKRGRVYDEMIPNASVVDIIRNVETGEVLQIITDEQITLQTGENRQSVVNRKRYFTPMTVRTEWTGDVPTGLVNRTVRNTSGVMPIPFANGVLDNSVRGKTVYTRLISHLKSYHDVKLKWDENLFKFNAKQVQTIAGSVDDWLNQNPQLPGADFDVASNDLILNKENEDTKYIFPESSMTEAFKENLSATFYNLVEGSGVSEIVFGLTSTGNHASVEGEMTKLANTVQDMRNQVENPTRAYVAARLRLMAGATMAQVDPEFKMTWNDLEVVGQEVKAKIMQAQAEAMAKLTQNASIPLETQHKFLLTLYPKFTEPDYATWEAGLMRAARFKQYQSANYIDALESSGKLD